jgi:hypothetical protein
MRPLIVTLLLVAAVLVVAGLVTASTTLGLGALAVVGVAWLIRQFARELQEGTV